MSLGGHRRAVPKGIPTPRAPSRLRSDQGYQLSLRHPGCGGGAAIWGSTPEHCGTSGRLSLERSSALGSRAPPQSARPDMTPGSLPARTQHLGKVPTDASAFLPAQVGGGAPPAARPLGAGIAAARALPRAHPHERPRGDRPPGTRATPRGLRSRPLAPAARRGQAGPARLGSAPASRDPEAGPPPPPPPRDSLARGVVAAAGILFHAPRSSPPRNGIRGRAACGLRADRALPPEC